LGAIDARVIRASSFGNLRPRDKIALNGATSRALHAVWPP